MRSRQFTMTTFAILFIGATNLISCSSGSSSPTEPLALEVTAESSAVALGATTAAALDIAIEDEYKARAFYDAVKRYNQKLWIDGWPQAAGGPVC